MSAYKGWLRRPADHLKFKSRHTPSNAMKMMNEQAHSHHDHGRKKRYYFQNNFWDEKAYCLRNSKDVVSEVHSSSIIGCSNNHNYREPISWFQNTDYTSRSKY
jgi:hypothetical protein